MELARMVGCKLFKVNEDDTIDMVRIKYVKKYPNGGSPSEITIYNYNSETTEKVRVDSLKEFSPLEPDGICTFNIAKVLDSNGKIFRDVIVTGNNFANMKLGDVKPYCICRQAAIDIFYSLFHPEHVEEKNKNSMVGVSVNMDSVPVGYDWGELLCCEEIEYFDFINFYRTDTLNDILGLVDVKRFDKVLEDLYNKHVEAVGNPTLQFKSEDHGWCKTLKKLLEDNNFQCDLNDMLGVTDVGFNISEYIINKRLQDSEEEYESFTDDLRYWLSSIYKLNIKETYVFKYDHDIDLDDYKDSRYFLLRDINNILYLVVYTLDGEFKEAELARLDKQLSFSEKFHIDFYNKYNKLS